jgi:acyl dehydratase
MMGGNECPGKYFEDWQEGDKYVTTGRTITTTDIEIYTNNMGDYNPLYNDEEFAKKEVYGTRIVPELLIHAISAGQISQTQLFQGTMLGWVKIDIDFFNSVKPGDTIITKGKYIGKRETEKREQGVLDFFVEVMNQRGEIIMKSNQSITALKKNV